ncbi:MAG TPA: zf-HC2 domain-containing protein [Pyrinomonadaceae bacterium]|nr:zf-HC2 domain-containing protein [Pyrinomonadaceae bacterium]
MTRCLDEAKLQSYFDGELSIGMMESVTSHLASCETCAAAARELEEESALLTRALTVEFEASVPTERLRQRIDAAVLGERVAFAQPTGRRSGLAAFFSGLLNFGTQRTLGFASLAVVLAFAAIIGAVMMRNKPAEPVTAPQQVAVNEPKPNPTQQVTRPVEVQNPAPAPIVTSAPAPKSHGTIRPNRPSTTSASAPKLQPVKLFPGERSYLQTIAKLDSTIKSNKKAMRPSLQVEYERNLAVVDRAIAATRSAAKSNPNDPDAADFMFAAYQSKVDLLNTIADARLSGGRGH